MTTLARRRRVVVIVAVYAVLFLGLMPALLWSTGLRLDRLTAAGPVPAAVRMLGGVITAFGLVGLAGAAVTLTTKGRGWPISHLPPARLVAAGPYRRVRHPLYLYFVTAFVGLGLAAGSWGIAVGAGGLLAVAASIYALGFEEPRLHARYGPEWDAYRRKVPNLIPLGPMGRRVGAALARAWRQTVPVLERLAARTVLFRIGASVWVTFGAFTAGGAAVMALWLAVLLGPDVMSTVPLNLFLVGLAVSSLVGGRLVWLAYQLPGLLREPRRTLRTVGFVSWGSLVGLVGFGWFFAGLSNLEPLWLLDRVLLTALPCMALGRLGCFTYGCCYGRPWRPGVRWLSREAKTCREQGAPGRLPRTPTQLLEAGGATLIAIAAVGLTLTEVPSGVVAAVIVMLYGVLRFGIDCLRDERRFTPWGLTAGQIASSVAVAAAWSSVFFLDGAAGWTAPATRIVAENLYRGLPAVAAAALIVFLVCGFHWRRVGRW